MSNKTCPQCGAYNPSGLPLPENCWRCKETVEAKKLEELKREDSRNHST